MELSTMKVQSVKGSCFVYIPIVWVKQVNLKKGDEVSWIVNEGDHKTLQLKKKSAGNEIDDKRI